MARYKHQDLNTCTPCMLIPDIHIFILKHTHTHTHTHTYTYTHMHIHIHTHTHTYTHTHTHTRTTTHTHTHTHKMSIHGVYISVYTFFRTGSEPVLKSVSRYGVSHALVLHKSVSVVMWCLFTTRHTHWYS